MRKPPFDATAEPHQVFGLDGLSQFRLPLNRKERYFTGTVLPMIIGCDEFDYIHRFLGLCGAPEITVDPNPEVTNLQLFTEYGFKESLVDGAETRFEEPDGKDTPDLVIYVEHTPSLLIGVEAKVFHRPPISDLRVQLNRQKKLMKVMADGTTTNPTILHVVLVPENMGAPDHIDGVPVLTWETLADAYRDVAPSYWIAILDQAMARYGSLASKSSSGGNNDDRITGEQINDRWKARDTTFTWMGRQGGLDGKRLHKDIDTGSWANQLYQVRHEPLPGNPNWFSIEAFINRMDATPS